MQQPEQTPTDPAQSDSLRALVRGVPFDLYLLARTAMVLGNSIQTTALNWQVYSPISLAFIGIARFVPSISISLFAGLVADAMDRRKILAAAQLAPALTSAVLFWLTNNDSLTMTPVYVLMVIQGVASAFETSARLSLLPQVVPRVQFARAVAMTNSMQSLVSVVGASVAGVIIDKSGVAPAYAAHLVIISISVIGLLSLRLQYGSVPAGSLSLAAVKEGLDFLKNRPVVLSAMVLDMLAVTFGGANALLPVYAKDILKVGASGFGLMRAARTVGSGLASAAMIFMPPVVNAGRVLIIVIVLYGLSTIAFGLAMFFPLSLLFFALTGLTDQVSVVVRQGIVQLGTPDALRGRVSSVNQVFTGASDQLGAVRAGVVADWTDAIFSVVSGGVGTLISLGIVVKLVPSLWTYKVGNAEEPADKPRQDR